MRMRMMSSKYVPRVRIIRGYIASTLICEGGRYCVRLFGEKGVKKKKKAERET